MIFHSYSSCPYDKANNHSPKKGLIEKKLLLPCGFNIKETMYFLKRTKLSYQFYSTNLSFLFQSVSRLKLITGLKKSYQV